MRANLICRGGIAADWLDEHINLRLVRLAFR